MKSTSIIFCLLSSLLTATALNAEGQKSHAHGLAILTLALTDDTLDMQFESPASNLTGFEYRASSLEEKQIVEATRQVLTLPNTWLKFVGADCQLKETDVDVASLMPHLSYEEQHDSHKGHDKHVHDDPHKHSEHHGKNHSDDRHSEIIAHYQFSCQGVKSLKSVSIALFEQFPRLEKINAMWVTDSQQGSKWLRPSSNTFSLR